MSIAEKEDLRVVELCPKRGRVNVTVRFVNTPSKKAIKNFNKKFNEIAMNQVNSSV